MAKDEKVNCTKLPHELFLIRCLYFETDRTNTYKEYIERLEKIKSEMLGVSLSILTLNTYSHSLDSLISQLKSDIAQINILLYDSQFQNELAEFSYNYNNTFHNCPNILICGKNQLDAINLIKSYPAFDLCIYNNDLETLDRLIKKIRSRTYDDQPIDLTEFKNLIHKKAI
jgi:hypothetical protein